MHCDGEKSENLHDEMVNGLEESVMSNGLDNVAYIAGSRLVKGERYGNFSEQQAFYKDTDSSRHIINKSL